ncbi:hypothetical protein [Agromyces seonyuensis]|uniref:Large exoprotein n=1 Tax=Agromyces seonyuensis TaxID=2662446 RepID=A0A6I4NTC5_9MICO|nr:hypothetical protein [Agromyces seonyuensis]MWB97480.1 hypothetical protein [Agromyces seonyuensis]
MDGIGGGVLVVIAAALWVAYLLPSWFRRRQYLATERNAVRLQQTLRILAETSETPEAVQVEATAREVAKQRRRLKRLQQEQDRAADRRVDALVAAGSVVYGPSEGASVVEPVDGVVESTADVAPAAGAPAPAEMLPGSDAPDVETAGPVVPAAGLERALRARAALRRGRLACTTMLLSSLAGAGVGVSILLDGGLVVGGILIGAGSLFALFAWSGLRTLARRRITAPAAVPAVPAAPTVERSTAADDEPFDVDAGEGEEHAWTPQPLPRPLTLSRGTVAAMAMASVEEAARLTAATKSAEFERRAAELEPEVPALPAAAERREPEPEAPAAPAATLSPYARMGYVDESAAGFEGLDSVLARRRNAG